eukprot:SAG31_NODE_46607_length_253_cov_1.662338_1_plen_21_part_01
MGIKFRMVPSIYGKNVDHMID